ncbi:MAG: hypothetical protein ABI583_01600 [Betaproteobacteria bacterium]
MNKATRIVFLAAMLTAAGQVAAIAPSPAAGMRNVDLRSFFHGDPPAPPKAPPPKQLATVSTAPGVVADAQIESFMRAFAEAIKLREGKPLLARLSDKYAIDDLPEDRKAVELFLQAIDTIPGATEITIKSVERKNDMRNAKVEFRYNTDNIKLKTFRFDAAGKLLWSDLFMLKRQAHGT